MGTSHCNIYSMGPENHSTFSSSAVAFGWGCMFSKSSSSFSLIVNCCHGLPRVWVQHNNSCCVFVCIPITTVRAEGCYPPPPLPLNITVSSLISHSWREDIHCTNAFNRRDGAFFHGMYDFPQICMCTYATLIKQTNANKIIFCIPPTCYYFFFIIGIRLYHNLYKCVSNESFLCMLSFYPILNDAKSIITILVAISC